MSRNIFFIHVFGGNRINRYIKIKKMNIIKGKIHIPSSLVNQNADNDNPSKVEGTICFNNGAFMEYINPRVNEITKRLNAGLMSLRIVVGAKVIGLKRSRKKTIPRKFLFLTVIER